MKNKILNSSLFFALLLVFSLGIVSAVTIDSPVTGGTLTGTSYVNITVGLINVQNCTFSTTADGVFNTMLNSSANQQLFNATNNTALLTEAEDTTISVICMNNTVVGEGEGTETVSVVANIDNTAPTCAYTVDSIANSVTQFNVEYLGGIGIQTSDGSSDTTDLTYSWILFDPSGSSQQTSTSTSPSFSGSDFDELGEFILSLRITDEASKTTGCTNKTIFVNSDSDAEIIAGITASQTTQTTQENTIWIVLGVIGFIIIIAVAGFFVINSSKK